MQYIGIVRLDRIGDTVLTLPAVKLLKERYPDYKIVGIFNEYNSKLFLYNNQIIHPYFDAIEIFPVNLFYKQLNNFSFVFEFFNYLRTIFWKSKYTFDKIFVFSPTTTSYLLGLRISARKKYTYFYETRLNRVFFSSKYVHYNDPVDKDNLEDFSIVRHEILQNIEVVKLDGIITENHIIRPELFVPDLDVAKYDVLVFDKELFFFNDTAKNWMRIFVKVLLDELISFNRDLKVGFVSRRKQDFENCLNPDIMELLCLVREARCVVCFDGGIVHIASAFNTDIIAIFTNRYFDFDVRRWGPLSDRSRIVKLDIFEDYNLNLDLVSPVDFAKQIAFYVTEYIEK